MGCCLGVILLAGAPRLALFVWWLFDSARVTGTFSGWPLVPGWIWLIAGFLLLPWLTVAYIFVLPGGISTIDWIILFVALLLDFGAFGGGSREYRRRRVVA